MSCPGRLPEGRVVRNLVTLADIVPTVLDIAAGKAAGRPGAQSLAAGLPTERCSYAESEWLHHDYGWAPLYSLTMGRFKYIESPEPEFYDLAADPGETNNQPEAWAHLVSPSRAALRQFRAGLKTRKAPGAPLDEAALRALQSLGYLGSGPAPAPPADPREWKNPRRMIAVHNACTEAGRLRARGLHREAIRKSNNGYYSGGRALWPAYEKLMVYAMDDTGAGTNGIPTWAEQALKTRGDSDGDGLSDYDEVMQYGSSPMLIDSDGDGLPDADEVAIGTGPGNWDTDGDGMGDGWETVVFADPLSADFTNMGSPVATITIVPAQTNAVEGEWAVTNSTQIQSVSRRGSLSYSFTVTNAWVYAVEVTGTNGYAFSDITAFKLLGYVDGEYLGYAYLETPGSGKAWFATPWLTNGPHTLKLALDNVYNNTSLRVTGISLTAYDGPDADANGLADWIDHRLGVMCTVDPILSTNVSPLCVEGNGKFLSKMSATADGNPVTVNHAAGDRWYADVPLSATSAVEFVVSFEDGVKKVTNSLTWQPVNLLDAGDMAIRKDDSLLLTAVPDGATSGTVTVEIVGVTNYTTDIETPVAHPFTTSGVFTVVGTHDNGTVTTGAIEVAVVAASFPTNAPAVWWGKSRLYENPDIPAEGVDLEYDIQTYLTQMQVMTNGGISYYLGVTDADDAHYLVARLENGGAVCDSVKIDACWVLSDPSYYFHVVEFLEDGTMVSEARITVGYLPPDCTIRISVMGGGSTFENGATVLYITAADLSETGEYTYLIYTPPGMGLMCHYVRVYEGSTIVGTGSTD